MAAFGTGRFGLGTYGIGDGAQTVALGRASETDTAQALAVVQRRQLVQAAETDTAQPLAAGRTFVLGQALESDAAGTLTPGVPVAGGWSIGVGYLEATTTNLRIVTGAELPAGGPDAAVTTALDVGDLGTFDADLGFYTPVDATGVGAAVGPDRSVVVEWSAYVAAGDPHFSVVWTNDDGSLSGTLWENSTLPYGEWLHFEKIVTTPAEATQVFFTYQGAYVYMAGLSIRSGPLEAVFGPAYELDIAMPLTVFEPNGDQTVVLGQAAELDTAQTLKAGRVVPLGQATESDVAQPLVVRASITVPLGRATEADAAQPVTVVRRFTLGQATEVDSARPLVLVTIEDQVITLGVAVEVDTARPFSTQTTSPYVRITHSYRRGDGTAAEGMVTFIPRYPSAEGIFAPATFTNHLVGRVVDGELDISLLESNPATVEPSTWTYRVIEEIDNMLLDYDAYVDFAPPVVDLRELVQVSPDDGVP